MNPAAGVRATLATAQQRGAIAVIVLTLDPSPAPNATAGQSAPPDDAPPDDAPLDAWATDARLPLPRVGSLRLASLWGVDHALIARPDAATAILMPHGGRAIVRAVLAALADRGVNINDHPRSDPSLPVAPTTALTGEHARALYPEAATELEALALLTLAHAASARAVDLLLDQPRRWAAIGVHRLADAAPVPPHELADAVVLSRLIVRPRVVAVGPANIGKSSLLNALAGEGVAAVADEPGTTRDHVGVDLDLAGLAVRWVDTPGLRGADLSPSPAPHLTPSPIDAELERAAWSIAARVVAEADLVLLCADATAAWPDPADVPGMRSGCPVLRVALRTDLGPVSSPTPHTSVSVRRSQGLAELVDVVVERLVPAAALADPRPWAFWLPPPSPPAPESHRAPESRRA